MPSTRIVEVKKDTFWLLASDILLPWSIYNSNLDIDQASLMVPVGQIEGMTNTEIGESVRLYLEEARAFDTHCYAQHLLRQKGHYIDENLSELRKIRQKLIPYKQRSEAIESALSLINNILNGNPVHISHNELQEEKAKPPKPRYIYLITDGNYTKVGITENIKRRLNSLQSANPRNLSVITEYKVESPMKIEETIRGHYQDKQISGEWFNLSEHDIEVIERYLNQQ